MSNLQQRIAEIDRRSAEIIKRRKKLCAGMLISCVPLVLTVGILLAFGGQAESMEPERGTVVIDPHKSMISSIAVIEVSGNGGSNSFTDPEYILSVYEHLSACTEDESPETKTEVFREETHEQSMSTGLGIEAYRIELVYHEGGRTEYTLSGNVLINRTTGRRYVLTNEELRELKKLLCVSDE